MRSHRGDQNLTCRAAPAPPTNPRPKESLQRRHLLVTCTPLKDLCPQDWVFPRTRLSLKRIAKENGNSLQRLFLDVEREDDKSMLLLPTADNIDSSNRSASCGPGGCRPLPPCPLPNVTWQRPPMKTALPPRPEEADREDKGDLDPLDNQLPPTKVEDSKEKASSDEATSFIVNW
jgi:hypothetical protein